jgi:uncharacterized protein
MNSLLTLLFYIVVGLVGGVIGHKLKVPAGALVGAMVFVIAAKLILKSNWASPDYFNFGIQVVLGVLVGASFHPTMMQTLHKMIIPIVLSSVWLVAAGLLISVVFVKLGLLDIGTGYLGTSPGAMSVLLVMALDSQLNVALITCFHLFRVIFVILTAPLLLKLMA